MNIRMLEAALEQAESAHTLEEMQSVAAALRAALNAEEDPPCEECNNCGTALPVGCSGLFRYEGSACALNRIN